MSTATRLMPRLELALMRRGLDHPTEELVQCAHCHRHPLIGERVYAYENGTTLCELCKAFQRAEPTSSHLVHGPEFGHTIKIIDQRPSGVSIDT